MKIEEKFAKKPVLPISLASNASNGELANIVPPSVDEVKLGSPLSKDSPYSLTLSQRTPQTWNSSMRVII